MKTTVKQTIEHSIEVEVQLPYFAKSHAGMRYFKVINEHLMIEVCDFSQYVQIEVKNIVSYAFQPEMIQIDESEFNKAFDKVLCKIHATNEMEVTDGK